MTTTHHPAPETLAIDRPGLDRPGPGILGLGSLVLLIGSLAAMAAMSGGSTLPSPFGDTADVAAFYADHGSAARAAAMLQLASSAVLGSYAATVHVRQQRLGIRVAGPGIGFFGGTAAAVLLAVSACVTWALGQDVVSAQPRLTHALAYVGFAAGGTAHVVGLGLLVAGIALPAVRLRLLPLPLCTIGLVIACLAELSVLSMVAEPAQFLIPIGRFGALVWIVIAGFLLPQTRHSRETMEEPS